MRSSGPRATPGRSSARLQMPRSPSPRRGGHATTRLTRAPAREGFDAAPPRSSARSCATSRPRPSMRRSGAGATLRAWRSGASRPARLRCAVPCPARRRARVAWRRHRRARLRCAVPCPARRRLRVLGAPAAGLAAVSSRGWRRAEFAWLGAASLLGSSSVRSLVPGAAPSSRGWRGVTVGLAFDAQLQNWHGAALSVTRCGAFGAQLRAERGAALEWLGAASLLRSPSGRSSGPPGRRHRRRLLQSRCAPRGSRRRRRRTRPRCGKASAAPARATRVYATQQPAPDRRPPCRGRRGSRAIRRRPAAARRVRVRRVSRCTRTPRRPPADAGSARRVPEKRPGSPRPRPRPRAAGARRRRWPPRRTSTRRVLFRDRATEPGSHRRQTAARGGAAAVELRRHPSPDCPRDLLGFDGGEAGAGGIPASPPALS